MSFFSKILLIFIFSFSFSINVFSAIGPEEIPELKEKVYYNVSPSKPNVGDVVEIEAEMYGTDVKNSTFLWKINNKIFENKVGLNRFNFSLAEKTKVDLIITTGTGLTIERSFEFDFFVIVIATDFNYYYSIV